MHKSKRVIFFIIFFILASALVRSPSSEYSSIVALPSRLVFSLVQTMCVFIYFINITNVA